MDTKTEGTLAAMETEISRMLSAEPERPRVSLVPPPRVLPDPVPLSPLAAASPTPHPVPEPVQEAAQSALEAEEPIPAPDAAPQARMSVHDRLAALEERLEKLGMVRAADHLDVIDRIAAAQTYLTSKIEATLAEMRALIGGHE